MGVYICDQTDALIDGDPWIYRIGYGTKTVYLTLSRFEAYPISDRMRPRYARSARAVLDILAGGGIETETPNAVSEVKGMYNRILRRDQWDWLSVYKALGRPSNVDASLIVQCLTELRPLLTAGKIGEVKAFFQTAPLQLLRSGLENFLLYLQETYQWLPSGRLVTSKREGQRKLSASKRFVYYDAAKIERASLAHQETLSELSSFLQTRGFRVECNMYVDAFSRLKTGPAFFEAKSISEDNELEQVRGALSQLYEYRFRHRLYGATLWIVLSKAPQLSWLSEYLINDREVNLLWIENGVLAGPSMEAMTRAI
jgi:hypothetical protein